MFVTRGIELINRSDADPKRFHLVLATYSRIIGARWTKLSITEIGSIQEIALTQHLLDPNWASFRRTQPRRTATRAYARSKIICLNK